MKCGIAIQWAILGNKKKGSTDTATTWKNFENIMLSKRSQSSKATYYMKCPEKANPRDRK